MLPTNRRINKASFKDNLKGVVFHNQSLYLKLVNQIDLKSNQFAVIIPKKVKKTAVGRNLLKRRIFAVIQNNLKNIKNSFQYYFYIKKDLSSLSFSDLTNEVLDLLGKAKVLNEMDN